MNMFSNQHFPLNRQPFAKAYKIFIGRFYRNPFTPEMIEKKILFVHIPKTGGTSIATAILGKPKGHPYLYEFYMANKVYAKEFKKICVVRNPYDRVVSAFAYISKRDCNREFKDLFNELEIVVFDDLIRALDDKKKYRKICNYIVHFRSQHELIDCKGLKMDKIYKFEEFDHIERDLSKMLGAKLVLQKLNTSPRKKYKEYYDDFSRSVVERIYKKDLELFCYSF